MGKASCQLSIPDSPTPQISTTQDTLFSQACPVYTHMRHPFWRVQPYGHRAWWDAGSFVRIWEKSSLPPGAWSVGWILIPILSHTQQCAPVQVIARTSLTTVHRIFTVSKIKAPWLFFKGEVSNIDFQEALKYKVLWGSFRRFVSKTISCSLGWRDLWAASQLPWACAVSQDNPTEAPSILKDLHWVNRRAFASQEG